MKYLLEYKTFTTPNEKRINDILDKINKSGIKSISDYEKEILKHNGKIPLKNKYIGISNKLEFDYDEIEDYGDELRIKGTLTYKGEKYYGWFNIPTIEDRIGQNTWDFFKNNVEVDIEPDDIYELDSMIQELEFNFVDKN